MNSRILLADADAFFVAVARLVDPEGAGREPLLIVGGTPDGRGVVTSASYETRVFGVRSAMPTAQALRLCPNAKVVPVARNACTQKSKEILSVLRRYTPVVEPASIDEFYVDLTGTEKLYADETLEQTARRIRAHVLAETGLNVSIGGGTSKVIAKIAAKVAKPRPGRSQTGVFIVPAGSEEDFMAARQLADIPMVGPKFQQQLAKRGLRSVADAIALSEKTLTDWFGLRAGTWLYHRIRGRDTAHISAGYHRKSLGHEETFPRDIESDQELDAHLVRIATRVALDLRRKQMCGRTITVKIKDADFTVRSASKTLVRAVSTDRVVLRTARALLAQLREDRRTKARLLGVTLSQLSGRESPQLDLFAEAKTEREGLETTRDFALAQSVDDISAKFGSKSIVRGVEVAKGRRAGRR